MPLRPRHPTDARSALWQYGDLTGGSIVAAGATVGYLKPPSVLGLIGLGANRDRYTVYDADGRAVGRITHRSRFVEYAVVDIDQSAAEGLRALMLAVSAAVKFWLNERTGGRLG